MPQNRERVFMVSILNAEHGFEFPKPFPLEKRLRDVLEENVDESYYLSDSQVERILAHCERKKAESGGGIIRIGKINESQDGAVVHPNGISPCHCCGHGNMPKILELNETDNPD